MKVLKSEKKLCISCMQEHPVDIIEVAENETFNGISVNFIAVYEYCSNTDEYLETEEMMKSNGLAVKDAYRQATGLLTSAEIRRIREKYRISQKEFSEILNWGKATITRYENHQIQDRAHDDILRKIDSDPQWFIEMLNRAKDRISEKSYNKYYKAAYEQYVKTNRSYICSKIKVNTVVDILEALPKRTCTEVCRNNLYTYNNYIALLLDFPTNANSKAKPLLSV